MRYVGGKMASALLITFFAGGLLVSCSSSEESVDCLRVACDPSFYANGFSRVPGIEVGMTPEEVVRVLGNNFIDEPEGSSRGTITYSYPYYENGSERFYVITFRKGVVWQAVDDKDMPPGLFLD